MNTKSTIIALAWPDTKVIREGKWYDVPMKWFGFIKDDYYTAGHAAFLLVNHNNGEVHYFDYGRYHTPYQHGRVRDKITDPDIEIKLKAKIINDEIVNMEELLLDRYQTTACHGDGRLTAAIIRDICFNKAYQKAKEMQNREAIPYGPFVIKGSTCSRLVVQVVYAATQNKFTKFLIKMPYTVSATPRSNIKVLNDSSFYFEVRDGFIRKHKNSFYSVKNLFNKSQTKNVNQSFMPKTA